MTIDEIIKMIDRMISKAKDPSHLDDLNAIIEELAYLEWCGRCNEAAELQYSVERAERQVQP